MSEIVFKPPGPVARSFMLSDAFFRGIQGPVGSGKSSACAMELMRRAQQMPKDVNGLRRSRWAIVRNTYPELRTTTIATTWLEWFPEDKFGRFLWTPPYTHFIKIGDVEAEFIFMALDTADDVGKLLSFELTGAWVNEARELPKDIIDGLTMRVGRFPPLKGFDDYHSFIIADTNAPPTDHWWSIMSGQVEPPEYMTEEELKYLVTPNDWEFFMQPAGMIKDPVTKEWRMNPDAENVQNLKPNYYERQIAGKEQWWIEQYIGNKIGLSRSGKPVYPQFNPALHIREFQPTARLPVIVGMDFGLTPAAVFGQRFADRQIGWFDEITNRDADIPTFAGQILDRLALWENRLGEKLQYEGWGDPSGDIRSPSGETTFQILRGGGVAGRPAPGNNDPVLRIEAVQYTFNQLINGNPMTVIHPRCAALIRALTDGYRYARKKNVSLAEGQQVHDKVEKNMHSHVAEAHQYGVLGMGVGRELRLHRRKAAVPFVARRKWDVGGRWSGRERRESRLKHR